MKCPLCDDGVRRGLEEMDLHLNEAHDMDQDEREQFGGDFSGLIEAQIELEKQERIAHKRTH